MREYEIAFLIKEESLIPEILGMLKRHGAEIVFEGPVRGVPLAYEIARARHAYFGYFHFNLPADKAAVLDHELRMNSKILRFIIVTPPFRRRERKAEIKLEEEAAPPFVEPKVKAGTLPLSNEELEKKIDEILK